MLSMRNKERFTWSRSSRRSSRLTAGRGDGQEEEEEDEEEEEEEEEEEDHGHKQQTQTQPHDCLTVTSGQKWEGHLGRVGGALILLITYYLFAVSI